MNSSPILPLLMGPTASGKSALAEALAEFFPIEIISVDSALIYRGMDIGTAKPSKETLARIPHHLIDIRDPAESYSAAEFCEDVARIIPEILVRGHLPLLVGGTMMYFKALTQGLSQLPPADETIRAQLANEAAAIGWPMMHERLQQCDPLTAARLHPNDAQRIQRALEVWMITGKPLSDFLQKGNAHFPYAYHAIAVAPSDRRVLHERIAQRFDVMIAEGFIEEVKHLMQRADLTLNKPALRAVGYRQVFEGLMQDQPLAIIRERAIAATRQLAKRQLTWLRQWPDLQWLDSTDPQCLSQLKSILKNLT